MEITDLGGLLAQDERRVCSVRLHRCPVGLRGRGLACLGQSLRDSRDERAVERNARGLRRVLLRHPAGASA